LLPEELPHYAKKTLDLYFDYHFGWGEVCSNSHRGDFDLVQHGQHSKQFLGIKANGKAIIPQVIEVSFGVERLLLAILEDAYREEEVAKLPRTVLKLSPLLSPYFAAIIPLNKLVSEKAYQVYNNLLKEVSFAITYEATDSIGKSYRRQDAIGTYYCLTIDFQTLENNTLTIRERNSMQQERISLNNLAELLQQKYQIHYQEFLKN
jgi:glycyl-tRNA synthetase